MQLHKDKKKVLSPSSRFNTTVSNKGVSQSSKGFIPKNTSRSKSWAVRVYKQWVNSVTNTWMLHIQLISLQKAIPLRLFVSVCSG